MNGHYSSVCPSTPPSPPPPPPHPRTDISRLLFHLVTFGGSAVPSEGKEGEHTTSDAALSQQLAKQNRIAGPPYPPSPSTPLSYS